MAGDWIKWSKGLTRKMEILQMSARLHIAPAHAAGTLMQLMEWVDENVSVFDSDGNAHVTLGPLQSSALDVTLGVSGFMEAMAEVGWIRIENDDLVFVHAERHNGKTAKARALTKERVAAHRNGEVTHRALPEKRREEDSMLPLGDTVTAERIYDEYPRKIARPKAIEAIKRAAQLVATKADQAGFPDAMAYLLDRTLAYSKATAQWSIEDRQFIPHPTTWFNQGRFDDDPTTWERRPAPGRGPQVPQRKNTVWELKQREDAIRKQIRDFIDGHKGERYVGMKPGATSPYEWTDEGRREHARLKKALEDVQSQLASLPDAESPAV